jgi:transposase
VRPPKRYATWLMRSTPWMTYSGLWGRSLSPPPDRPLRIDSPAPVDQGAPGIGSEQSERVGEEDGGLGRLALENGPVRVVSVSVLFGSHTQSGCILPSMSEKRSLEESESTRLEGLYRKASDPVLRTHLLMVWRMSLGDPIRQVAQMVGYSEKWTREIARRYEEQGVEGLGDRRHGNPGAKERALLDEEGQAELREALLEGSPPGGGMWSGPKVARWIEQKRGLEKVHVQRGWEYLRKVRMSPQVPRPSNAQGAESEEREAFKKISPSG